MIRSVGRLGPVKVSGLVLWQLRGTIVAVLIVVGLLLPIPDASQNQYAAAVLSVLGIAASVFIGFRNTTAYNRWWEARTLWGGIIINSRTLHNGLTSVDTGAPGMAPILDRMRRRQVRYCWQLAAEMRGIAPVPGVTDLTEDPADDDATDLLNRQAADVAELENGGYIDGQARIVLMAANSGAATAQSGLERIRNEPIPVHYDYFIRALAWFFGVMAFNRLEAATENHLGSLLVGVLLLTTFVVAERVGGFIEAPMSNTVFDIPMYRICSTITGNLLGGGHPLAQPRQGENSIVWM
ncbi:MAG TPA: bestrophin family ion channel [Mycobacterium sp.]|uniref:bestrophin family ion channel n=1 Tax=Mycolicibacterium sp. TaxID=2320850 RepID=UPI0025E32091|nr:bestrophin family ion channel [Mycolicibacterium sp.]HPX38279.1 bestrophin family ion channel [Mycobacterium sp.]HQC78139.1 bestrophin family ion channel [Mycobacterium sp.]